MNRVELVSVLLAVAGEKEENYNLEDTKRRRLVLLLKRISFSPDLSGPFNPCRPLRSGGQKFIFIIFLTCFPENNIIMRGGLNFFMATGELSLTAHERTKNNV